MCCFNCFVALIHRKRFVVALVFGAVVVVVVCIIVHI